MKVTILFFLLAGILALSIWTWNVNPSRLEYVSINRHNYMRDQVEKIQQSTDLGQLKELAINQLVNLDEHAIERDKAVSTVTILLLSIIVLSIAALIVIFLEIANRGRNYSKTAK